VIGGLGAVSLDVADPRTRLVRWAGRGEGLRGAVSVSREAGADERIVDALRSTPDALPSELIEALVSRLRTIDSGYYQLRYIAERLAGHQEMAALKTLAEVDEDFDRIVRPFIAKLGDAESVGMMLQRLEESLTEGERPDSENLFWLDGALSEHYLPQLFRCLVLVYRPAATRHEWIDTMTPLMTAIRLIGSDEAVRGYDEILAEDDPDLRFLRLQREAVAQAELAKDGLDAAPIAAQAAKVPTLIEAHN
jgi:hypothetical protein